MPKAIVHEGQNLMDMCIMHLGDQSGLVDLAILNNLNPTDDIVPGNFLELPEVIDQSMVNYFSTKKIIVATNTDRLDEILIRRGIGFMKIGYDFIVT